MEENIKWALTKAHQLYGVAAEQTEALFSPISSFTNSQLESIQEVRYRYLKAHHFSYRTLEMAALSLGVFVLSKGMIKRFKNTAIVGGIGGCIWTLELVNPWNRV